MNNLQDFFIKTNPPSIDNLQVLVDETAKVNNKPQMITEVEYFLLAEIYNDLYDEVKVIDFFRKLYIESGIASVDNMYWIIKLVVKSFLKDLSYTDEERELIRVLNFRLLKRAIVVLEYEIDNN
tara:strand:- start:280 stop:651 length:372 start_codon:yes stop_codon:yes gene_type:complete